METVYENEYVVMQYYADKKLTEQIWYPTSKKMSEINFREFMIFWREFVIKNGVKYHLIDARAFIFTIRPTLQDWIATEIVGPTVQKGFEKIAQVLPEKDLFAQISVEQTMDENASQGGLNFAHFASLEEGRKWLLS